MRSSANHNSEPSTSILRTRAAINPALTQGTPPSLNTLLHNPYAVQNINPMQIELRSRRLSRRKRIRRISRSAERERRQVAADLLVISRGAAHEAIGASSAVSGASLREGLRASCCVSVPAQRSSGIFGRC
jgi:hypothetical protein